MHEYSLVRSLLARVSEVAAKHPGARVCQIEMTIGELAGIETELLQLAFDNLVADTPLQQVRLLITTARLEGCCRDCGHRFNIQRFRFVCPICDGGAIEIVQGEDLRLECVSLEWETEAAEPCQGDPL